MFLIRAYEEDNDTLEDIANDLSDNYKQTFTGLHKLFYKLFTKGFCYM